ncbi:phosphate/phosphite/phosphonate ABC transporter substrate-binding protein [Photobacterium kasasachensis]|uniref:phosphate/phosphite/phosphonate ABC transporter substrate-binding protein n=1 Tax=Photobacterium kasasachensis TaxID=2910240 RepID=UPI003D0EF66F
MPISFRRNLIFCLFIVPVVLLAFSTNVSAAQDGYTLKVGRLTSSPRKDLAEFSVFTDYLAKRLQHAGVSGGKVVFARDINEMALLINNKQVDVISDSLYPQLQLRKISNLDFLSNEHRDGVSSYHSILVTRKDSGINQLSDLKGKMIAFEDETSTPSYFVPRVILTQTGMMLVKGTPSPEQVGYTFAREEINITKWVHSGKVAVGALSSKDWTNPKRVPPALKADLRIMYRSAEFPRSILAVRTDLDPQLMRALRNTLLETTMTVEDKAEIYPYRSVTGFSPVMNDKFDWFETHITDIDTSLHRKD